MLSATGLCCSRGQRRLFSGVDLAVGPGEWLHVRGANGAGKTSLLRIVAGLGNAEEGVVYWNNKPVSTQKSTFNANLLYLGHMAAVKDDLSALENLRFAAALAGANWDLKQALLALAGLGLRGREDLPVRFLSAGQKRRVMMSRMALSQAPLWILDEPFTALDDQGIEVLAAQISAKLAAGGMAVLTSHQAIPLPGGKVLQL